ncbi:disulfide bond formation protein B [Vulcaniibacterium thermophilum]|uniref:Disulfide bond formation protein B n=1 Tax=Vulcaniibacterium thermophilum TaxID=1169913 RepID=A0A918ZA55_9GAMM|nr:disulfide bond formation protein B [Vulcaniibacterium thermophilum]GHE43168.1 disulfide bond formation protein B [Vulcaniibacterium thermophilum]
MPANPFRASFRTQFLLGFLACAGLMGYALYAQHVQGFEPCPLCIFQRVAVIALGVVFLLGALHGPRGRGGRAAWGVLALLAAGAGIAVAGRHVWLQNLPPDQVPACGPPFEFMRETLPLAELVSKVLRGSGECANIDWTLLGLSMPAWVLISFVALALWAGYAAFRR